MVVLLIKINSVLEVVSFYYDYYIKGMGKIYIVLYVGLYIIL